MSARSSGSGSYLTMLLLQLAGTAKEEGAKADAPSTSAGASVVRGCAAAAAASGAW